MANSGLFTALDEVSVRSSPFVPELASFLAQYGLPVGTAEAMSGLASKLTQGSALADDLLSMLTVICAQEGAISTVELLGLVLFAACGPEIAPRLGEQPNMDAPARQIFQFVLEVRRSVPSGGSVPGAFSEAEPFADEAPEDLPMVLEPSEVMPEAEQAAPIPPIPFSPSATSKRPGSARDARPMLARALALAADEETFATRVPEPVMAPEPVTTVAPQPERVAAVSQQSELKVPFSTVLAAAEEAQVGQGRVWAAGGGGVILGLFAGLLIGNYVGHHPGTPAAEVPASAGPAATAAPAADSSARSHRGAAEASRSTFATRAESESRHPSTAIRESGSSGRLQPQDRAEVVRPENPGTAAGAAAPSSGFAATRRGTSASSNVGTVREVHLLPPATATRDLAPGRLHSGHVVLGTSGIMAANILSSPAPAYPAQASAAAVQGEVIIEAIVGKQGEVIDTRVVSGPPLLRQAALDAVQQWRYRPYEVDGEPSEIATTARVDFRLDR